MLKVNPEVIKVYRQHLIKTIKERVKPYLKDSEYRRDNEKAWAAPGKHPEGEGRPIKVCFFKRQVKLKFLSQMNRVVGFTSSEVITNYGMFLETIYLSNLCIEDLQELAGLDLDSLVKVQKPARPVSGKKKA